MAARPPYRIDDALLDRARQRRDDYERFTPADGDRIVEQVQRDAAAAGVDERGFVRDIAESSDVSSPRDGSLLWSGRCPDDPALSNRYVAEAWAERQNATDPGHPATTLEGTAGGGELDNLRLFDLSVDQLRELGLRRTDANEMWSQLSQRYTEQAAGQVRAFGTDAHPKTDLYRSELPTLRANPEVGADQVEFAYEPPEVLSTGEVVPDNVRTVLAEPGNQARLQLYDLAQAGYLNPTAAGAMSPDALRDEVARLAAEGTAADRARSASPTTGAPTPVPSPGVEHGGPHSALPPPTPADPATPDDPRSPAETDDGAPHSALPRQRSVAAPTSAQEPDPSSDPEDPPAPAKDGEPPADPDPTATDRHFDDVAAAVDRSLADPDRTAEPTDDRRPDRGARTGGAHRDADRA